MIESTWPDRAEVVRAARLSAAIFAERMTDNLEREWEAKAVATHSELLEADFRLWIGPSTAKSE